MASLLQSPSANLRRTPNERDHLEGSCCTKTGSAVSNGWSSGTRGSFPLLTQPVLVSGKLKENRAIRGPQIARDDLGMFPGFQLAKRLLFLNMRPLAGPWSVYASPSQPDQPGTAQTPAIHHWLPRGSVLLVTVFGIFLML